MNAQELLEDKGLLYAFDFDGQGGCSAISADEIDQAEKPGATRWVHLDFTKSSTQKWLRKQPDIDPIVIDALLDEDSRPRELKIEDGLLVTLRGVNSNPDEDPEDMVSIRMWLTSSRIVSTRRRLLFSVRSLREDLENGKGPSNVGQYLTSLAHRLGERMGLVIDKLDDAIEDAEHKFEQGKQSVYSGEFSLIRRQAARLRRYLAPQRDALERLSRETDSFLTNEECLELREEANQVTRYLEDLDLVRERAMLAQEEILGRLAQEQNSRMYVLSIVAAIFLPLSFLTGLMGMNVAGLPGTENTAAFIVVCLVMLVAALGIVALFKWRKWL